MKDLSIKIKNPIFRLPKKFLDANRKNNMQKIIKANVIISDDKREIKIVVTN